MLKGKSLTEDSSPNVFQQRPVCVCVCRAAYLWRWWSSVHLIQASGAGSTPTPSQYFQTLFGEWMSTRPEWERMCCLCYIDLVAASSVVHYNTAQVTGCVALGEGRGARRLHKGAVRLNRKCTGALNIYSTPKAFWKVWKWPSLSLQTQTFVILKTNKYVC